ncbi:MoaD/ThiS family protein [Biformimicrobium ophioploci]|uniref:Molybdopterin synthase sulfur carrier subunit n=1 Tax=Biformimicrobium ophioploci TaxID=3036711 RepID=A0ABQ6M053_9GAMM|nr:MoaD/ThiS family protein [Microbulbifer sp. NKW57]GMG87720.1 molybdopterin synthase sulfur carrier subunit [Microbulbifer sp. NKW57]
MVKVLFFARLRQQLGTGEVRLENFSGSIAALRDALCDQNPAWRAHLCDDNIRTALNQELVATDCAVAGGDEVAFFPPVTGG